jgi:cytosine/adenosine deaminase-related metal-dependent hydrolase
LEYEGLRDGLNHETVDRLEARRRDLAAADPALRSAPELLHRILAGPGKWHRRLTAGTIEKGARAQLNVWDLDHPAIWPADDPFRALAFGAITPALLGVVAAGRWVGELGRPAAVLRTAETRDWFDEAHRRREELLVRAGLR